MTFKRLKNLARKIINAKTYQKRAQIMRAYAYRTGKVKQRGTYGYYFMKLARVFDYYAKNTTGNSPDLFSIFSGKNTKLHYVNFSTLPGFTCPGAGECLNWCYSFKAWRNPAVFCRQLQNTILLDNRKSVIRAAWNKLKPNIYVRLYVDGDIDSIETLGFWFSLLNTRRDLKSWGYSKSWNLFLDWHKQGLRFPDNYCLNISSGSIYDDDNALKSAVLELPITRGEFVAVDLDGHYSNGFDRYDDTNYHREVRDKLKAAYPGQRAFSCTGKCHDCLPSKTMGNRPACAVVELDFNIGNGTH